MTERVTKLRHVAVTAPNFEATCAYYTGGWGMDMAEVDERLAFLAAPGSPEQYILRLRKAEERRLDLVAWGVDDVATVDALAAKLAGDDIRFVREPDSIQTPGGGYGFRFFDPDGRVVEISTEVEERSYRTIEERETVPVKLSHVVFASPNLEETATFYMEKLGFKLSCWIGERMCFLRCTSDHHGLALVRSDDPKLNHFAIEYRGLDEYMRTAGRVMKAGGILSWGPGRHPLGAGDNAFQYFWDPNGYVSEVTTGMQQCDDDWQAPRIGSDEPQDQWFTATRPDAVPEPALVSEVGHWLAPPI
jgi:catechol 2,3-dioxygenase-like lactoylglutathione lyase family enzyme